MIVDTFFFFFFFFSTTTFSADAREVALSQASVWFDQEILKSRATFRGRQSEPSILAISNVTLDDQSVYRCRVDFREAKSRNARVNLTVIGKLFFFFLFFFRSFPRGKILC